MHAISSQDIDSLPQPESGNSLRLLLSGCIGGHPCGFNGTTYGVWPFLKVLKTSPLVELVTFCPEDQACGTPREICNIHGGNGFDVLEGRARVLTESGKDWTGLMLLAAESMLRLAQDRRIHLAILMDISAACGSQVIYDGHRTVAEVRYQKGPGVCAALLQRHGFPVISQRDYRLLEHLHRKLDASHAIDPRAADHHETSWYREYFAERRLPHNARP